MPAKKKVKATKSKSKGKARRTHKAQVSALTGGKSSRLPIKAIATPARSFLSFAANQPPKNLYTVLRTANYGNLTYANWSYSLYPNSCNDPTGTLGSGKPRYFSTFLGPDATSSLYRRYRVHETYVSFDVTNLQTYPIQFGVSTYRSGTTGVPGVTSLAEARERSDTRTMIIPSAQAGGSSKTMTLRIKMKDILGFKDLADDDSTGALYNANPASLVVTQFFIQPLDGSEINIEANVSLSMLQKCQFYELNDVSDN